MWSYTTIKQSNIKGPVETLISSISYKILSLHCICIASKPSRYLSRPYWGPTCSSQVQRLYIGCEDPSFFKFMNSGCAHVSCGKAGVLRKPYIYLYWPLLKWVSSSYPLFMSSNTLCAATNSTFLFFSLPKE